MSDEVKPIGIVQRAWSEGGHDYVAFRPISDAAIENEIEQLKERHGIDVDFLHVSQEPPIDGIRKLFQ